MVSRRITMADKERSTASIFDIKWQAGAVTLALVVVCAATIIGASAAQAQTFSVLHNFTGGLDGAGPYCRSYRRTLRSSVRNGGRRRNPTAMAQFSS